MKAEGRFLVYCMELYRLEKSLTGKQVLELFKECNVIGYIMACYESLHTTGWQYTFEDIDGFIADYHSE